MANITNAVVVRFSDERARTMADELAQLHYRIEAWLAEWTARGISGLITAAGASELVADESVTNADGRIPITGTALINLRAALLQMQTALDTTAVSGVGAAPFAIANGIQVNGSPQ